MPRLNSNETVELNVTAMLDMAFQLLAFFVLTFRSSPIEPGFMMHMPPAMPVVVKAGPEPPVEPIINIADFKPAGVDTLRIDLYSESGRLEGITLSHGPVDSLDDLRQKLRPFLEDPKSPIEQIVVHASDRLQYSNVMEVVGIAVSAN